ncbi:hypothetical protein SDC9_170229 [bioreactor metagenome]|uniref:Uncharacterized protein n=1 Tax=bioreactor metagenome TaxID=1076179 RepID=A0A645GFW1_9ZZZZ
MLPNVPVALGKPAASTAIRFAFAPWIVRPRKSGTLNVVLPSPAPKAVPISAKSPAYVVREYRPPLHNKCPVLLVANEATRSPTSPKRDFIHAFIAASPAERNAGPLVIVAPSTRSALVATLPMPRAVVVAGVDAAAAAAVAAANAVSIARPSTSYHLPLRSCSLSQCVAEST